MTTKPKTYWDMEDLLRRLRRVEGQVRGVQSMIQSEQPCRQVLVQVAAIEGAMKQVARIVSACNVAERVALASEQTDQTEAIKEALKDLIRYG